MATIKNKDRVSPNKQSIGCGGIITATVFTIIVVAFVVTSISKSNTDPVRPKQSRKTQKAKTKPIISSDNKSKDRQPPQKLPEPN